MVKNFRGMEQFDWLQDEFFTDWVYTTAKTCPVENFKHRRKNDIVTNIATFVLLGGVFQKSSFLGNLKPSDKKLDPRKTPT